MATKTRQRRSLLFLLLGIIVTIVVIVLGAHSAHHYYAQRDRMSEEMRQDAAESIARMTRTIAPFIEAYAVNEYDNLVATEIEFNHLYAVVVRDLNMGKVLGQDAYISGKIRGSDGRVVDLDFSDAAQRQQLESVFFTDAAPILSASGETIGRVSVYVTDAAMQQALARVLRESLMATATMALLLIAALVFFILRLFVRPLVQIAKTIEQRDSDGIPTSPAPDFAYREIAVLTDTMNGMLDVIRRSRDALQQHRDHLEKQVTQRTSELRQQQAFVEAVLENLADGIVACDERGNLSLFNRATREMHGVGMETLPPERWAGHYKLYLEDGITPMNKENVPLFRAYLGETVKNQEFVIEHRDGGKLNILASGQAMFDEQGSKIGAVVAMHDITEQKRIAAELQRAKEAAEAANRAKSVFLANMSHELRTPLNAILGFAQIMEHDTRIPGDDLRNIATINRSGRHLLALINDVLAISRIEAGRIQVVREAFDLPAALTAVEEMIRIRAEAKGLSFVVERPTDLPSYVLGDPHHLRQVLINLLGNAVKYTDRGQIVLRVHAESNERIRFDVSDTGPGIAGDEQERIFTAFYQTAGGIAKGEGTGLGLTISREFVRLMGGDISVVSAPGKGSSFGFSIPLPFTDAVPFAGGGASIVGLADGQTAPRILVAEDQPDSQQVVEQLLKRIGCQVQIAANGQMAIDLFQTWHPQLVLMDMRMPVMDGYQATHVIRSLPGGDRIPIVALTASTFEEDRGRVLAAGCNELVKKPIEQNCLFEVVGRLLGLRFEYAEAVPTQMHGTVPAVADLSALAAEVRKALSAAAVTLDKEAILAIVARLGFDHRAEADVIVNLVGDYRFDKIEELCK